MSPTLLSTRHFFYVNACSYINDSLCEEWNEEIFNYVSKVIKNVLYMFAVI